MMFTNKRCRRDPFLCDRLPSLPLLLLLRDSPDHLFNFAPVLVRAVSAQSAVCRLNESRASVALHAFHQWTR